MPTVNIDVSRQFDNYLNDVVRNINIFGDLNPGQQATLNNLDMEVSANAEVRIAGLDVDITVDVDFDPGDYPEYISRTIAEIQEYLDLYADKLSTGIGYDASQLIDQAYQSL